MKRRVSVFLVVLLVLAVLAVAWARAYSLGASNFASNGSPISGWHWLRSSGHTATWTFDAGALQGAKGVYINLNPLVTNGTNGGSGYDTTVKYTIQGARTQTGTITVVNPFRPTDPQNSGGLGYQAYGHSGTIPSTVYRGCSAVKVTISYPFPNGKHVAVNNGCMGIGYSK